MISINLEEYSESKPSVVTVGSFDGIHLGHIKLIEKTISISKQEGLKSIILTFNPHPKVVLNKKSNFSFLSTYDEKNTIFKSLDFDFLVVKKFDDAFSENSKAPKMLLLSVIQIAGWLSFFAKSIILSIWSAPNESEYAEWTLKWINKLFEKLLNYSSKL